MILTELYITEFRRNTSLGIEGQGFSMLWKKPGCREILFMYWLSIKPFLRLYICICVCTYNTYIYMYILHKYFPIRYFMESININGVFLVEYIMLNFAILLYLDCVLWVLPKIVNTCDLCQTCVLISWPCLANQNLQWSRDLWNNRVHWAFTESSHKKRLSPGTGSFCSTRGKAS